MKGVLYGVSVVVAAILFVIAMIWAGAAVAQEIDLCQAQERLAAGGYYSEEVDCRYGPAMRAAVRRFQRDNGIHVDGQIGEDTWCKLTGQCPTERVEEDEIKAPPVADEHVPERSARAEVTALCKPAAIDEISQAMWFESWAEKGVRRNWARKAQFLHGEIYANPENARVVKSQCEPLPVGMKKKYRCHFVAFPCRAGE